MIQKITGWIFIILLSIEFLLGVPLRKGTFIWPSSLCNGEKISSHIDRLHKYGITDIFLLVKGEAGATLYPSNFTYRDLYLEKADRTEDPVKKEKLKKLAECVAGGKLLTQLLQEAHRRGIKVHAWFLVSADQHYLKLYPEAGVFHLPKPEVSKYPYPVPDRPHINLAYPSYKKYFFTRLKAALSYPFDGIMLDKIRYTHLVYTWDSIHIAKAAAAGLDFARLMELGIRTLYGKEEDKELFVYRYRDGDRQVRQWVKLRMEDVKSYVEEARRIADEKGLELSADFMPEGAYDENFADVYYAQNYQQLSPMLDFVVIMAYAKAFSQPPTWVKMVAANARSKLKCKLWIAVQGYGGVEPEFVSEESINARVAGIDGLAVFRYGEMSPKHWETFKKAAEKNIAKERKKQVLGLIYKGGGTIRNCWQKSFRALLLSNRIIPFLVSEQQLRRDEIYKGKRFILIPGGGGSSEAAALGEEALAKIDKFVKKGGGYVGVCAGAFLAVRGYWNNLTHKLQIVNTEALDVDHWNRGSGPVVLEIKRKHFIFQDIKGKTFVLQYYSGPVLVPSDLPLPSYKELAVFRTDYHKGGARPGDMLGKTAILEARYGKGRVILFSPHPELTPGKERMLARAVLYVSGIRKWQ